MTRAMINSLNETDNVDIVEERGVNDVIARYNGKLYTAIYNPFVGLYYVDDIYGKVEE